jgi:hypothetical protein
MELEAPRKLTKSDVGFLLLFGAFQGAIVGLMTALLNRHHDGHWESQRHLVTRIGVPTVIFALGAVASRWLFPRGVVRVPRTPMGARLQTVVFVALMLFLAFALWRML